MEVCGRFQRLGATGDEIRLTLDSSSSSRGSQSKQKKRRSKKQNIQLFQIVPVFFSSLPAWSAWYQVKAQSHRTQLENRVSARRRLGELPKAQMVSGSAASSVWLCRLLVFLLDSLGICGVEICFGF